MMKPMGIGCLALDFHCTHKENPTTGGMRHQEEQGTVGCQRANAGAISAKIKSDILALPVGGEDTLMLHWRSPGPAPGMRFPMNFSCNLLDYKMNLLNN